MADNKRKFVIDLEITTKEAEKQFDSAAKHIKDKIKGIGDAADKMTVFKDLVDYIGQIDSELERFKSIKGLDIFNKIFGDLDKNLKNELESVFNTTTYNLAALDQLRAKFSGRTKENTTKEEAKALREEVVELYKLIGAEKKVKIAKTLSVENMLKKSQEALEGFAIVWEDVNKKISKGLTFGTGGSGASNGVGGVSAEVQSEVDKLQKEIEELEDLKKRYEDAKKVISKTTIPKSVSAVTTIEGIRDLIKEFDNLEQELKNGDKTSANYYNNLIRMSEVILTLKKSRDVIKEDDALYSSFTNTSGLRAAQQFAELSDYAMNQSKSVINNGFTLFDGSGMIEQFIQAKRNEVRLMTSAYDELDAAMKKAYSSTVAGSGKSASQGLIDEMYDDQDAIEELIKDFARTEIHAKEASEYIEKFWDSFTSKDGPIPLEDALNRICNILSINIPKAAEKAQGAIDGVTDGTGEGSGSGSGGSSGSGVSDEALSSLEETIKTEIASIISKIGETDFTQLANGIEEEIRNLGSKFEEIKFSSLEEVIKSELSSTNTNIDEAVSKIVAAINNGDKKSDGINNSHTDDTQANAATSVIEANTSAILEEANAYKKIKTELQEYYDLVGQMQKSTLEPKTYWNEDISKGWERYKGSISTSKNLDPEHNIAFTYNSLRSNINKGDERALNALKSEIISYWQTATEMPSVDKLLSNTKVELETNKGYRSQYAIPKKYQEIEKAIIEEIIAINKNNQAYEEEHAAIRKNNEALAEKAAIIRESILELGKDKNYTEGKNSLGMLSQIDAKRQIINKNLIPATRGALSGNVAELKPFEDTLEQICNILGIEIPVAAKKAEEAKEKEAVAHRENADAIKEENMAKAAEKDESYSEKISQLKTLKEQIDEVKSAVELKTQAFKDEGDVVNQVVSKETIALDALSTYLDTIYVTIKHIVDGLNKINSTKLNDVANTDSKLVVDRNDSTSNKEWALNTTLIETNRILGDILLAVRNDEDTSNIITGLEGAVKELRDVSKGIINHQQRQTDTLDASKRIDTNGKRAYLSGIAANAVSDNVDNVDIDKIYAAADGLVGISGAVKNAEGVWEGFSLHINEANEAVDIATKKNSLYAKKLNEAAAEAEKAAAKETTQTKIKAKAGTSITGIENKFNEYKILANKSLNDINESFVMHDKINQHMEDYTKSLERLKKAKIEYDNVQEGDEKYNTLENEFYDAKVECKNLETGLKSLLDTYEKFKGSHKDTRDLEVGKYDLESAEDRKKALQKYVQDMYGAEAKIKDFNQECTELNFVLKNSDGSISNMTASFDKLRTSIGSTASKAQVAQGMFKGFLGGVTKEMGKLLKYFTARFGIDELFQAFRTGVQYVRDIDSALTELKKVTSETDATYERFLQTASKTAGVVGSTVAEITQMSAEWARLKYLGPLYGDI